MVRIVFAAVDIDVLYKPFSGLAAAGFNLLHLAGQVYAGSLKGNASSLYEVPFVELAGVD